MTVASIGFAYAKSADTVLSNIKSNGTINVDGSGNTSNGATGTHVAGIAGFASIEQNSASRVYIRSCVSNSVARSSGIVAAANKGTVIEDCVNNGCNTNSFATTGGGRIGNISCITGSGSSLPAAAYLYIDGDTLTMAVMAALDSGILTAMANNYRLNGSAASPQL